MKSSIGTLIGVAALLGAVGAGPGRRPAGTATINPTLLITNVLRQPVDHQQRQIAFDESLRQAGPAPANRDAFTARFSPTAASATATSPCRPSRIPVRPVST